MKKLEKYLIFVIVLIMIGAIGTAVYLGINKFDNKAEVNDNQFNNDENDESENQVNSDNSELENEKPANEEEQNDEDDIVSCLTEKKIKEISYGEFNKLSDYDICLIYKLKDLNTIISVSKQTFGNLFDIKINGVKVYLLDDMDNYGYNLKIGKYNDNIVFILAWGSDETAARIYDKVGTLKYLINDNIACKYGEVYPNFNIKMKSYDKEIEVYQKYAESELAGDECIAQAIGGLKKYCKNGERSVNVFYKLEEINGKFELKQSGFECIE